MPIGRFYKVQTDLIVGGYIVATTKHCLGGNTGKSAVEYMDDFILWATRLSPEEQEVCNNLRNKNRRFLTNNLKGKRVKEKNSNIKKQKADNVKLTNFETGYNKLNPILQQPDLENLSPKEIVVAELLLLGWDYKEIGEILSIGVCTVKTHVNNIYSKKQVHSLQQFLVKSFNTKKSIIPITTNKKFKDSDLLEIKDILGG